ncbi:uncharacterized protein LOC116177720 isoform X2 [Photinus pyralis]|uniref:uncharacterized protein LOC116177720 isoform X2 n=1 Tax=Photinus pyralis TaxID=7054 RepID=UPI0012673FC3|nr:uncharacterized protein LOC116177720 isoform X2 [Photinus pyralis]
MSTDHNKPPENHTSECPPSKGNKVGEEEISSKEEKQMQNKLAELQSAFDKEKLKSTTLQKKLQARTQECDNLKSQLGKFQKEFTKKSLKGKKGADQNSSDAATCASSVIFEKTKMCKNQELQIEALTQQVTSLKEIVSISKEMLGIRNLEVKQLQDKLDCMELKFIAERDRHSLVNAKLEKMANLNTELKNEYQKQMALFTVLQKSYHDRMDTNKTIQEE